MKQIRDSIRIVTMAEEHIESFRACLDSVCRERRYLALTQAPPAEAVREYIRSAIAWDGLMKALSPGLDIGRHLDQACEHHIKLDALRSLTSLETLSGWFGGNAALTRDGFLRAFVALKRFAGGPAPAAASFSSSAKRQPRKTFVWLLQFVWILLCLAAMWRPQRLTVVQLAIPLLLGLAAVAWQALRHLRASAGETSGTKT